eukprot:6205333-Pleurochrysis_carterae.AAC.7
MNSIIVRGGGLNVLRFKFPVMQIHRPTQFDEAARYGDTCLLAAVGPTSGFTRHAKAVSGVAAGRASHVERGSIQSSDSNFQDHARLSWRVQANVNLYRVPGSTLGRPSGPRGNLLTIYDIAKAVRAVGERARVRGLDALVGWLRVVALSGCVGHAH